MLIPAKDVYEAVELATRMKRAGKYQWFRGQTRNWMLASSLVRRAATHDNEVERVKKFLGWVRATEGLEALSSNLDAAIAVAQHYGLATHFIDFTTEPLVAGYFASEGIPQQSPKAFDLRAEETRFFGSKPATPDVGCILCLDRDDVMGVWETVSAVKSLKVKIEFLEFHVPDLWRLEAQHGVFFFCPGARFEEVVYDLDRIVFPHTGQVKSPPTNMIYPDRKSHLEQLLDQYFLLELIEAGNQMFQGLPPNLIPNKLVLDQRSMEEDSRYLTNGPVPVHPSWTETDLSPYANPAPEKFFDAHTAATCMVQWASSDARSVAKSVRQQVLSFLRSEPEARRRLVRWVARNEGVALGTVFAKAATCVFDAMRALPFADDELALAIGNCAGLLAANDEPAGGDQNPELAASARLFGSESVAVEIGTTTGAYSRAWVGRQDLLAAFRDDIMSFFTEEGRARYTADPTYLLMEIGRPHRLFPFDRFRRLFYAQAIPSQAVWRPDLPMIASPARVSWFGLP